MIVQSLDDEAGTVMEKKEMAKMAREKEARVPKVARATHGVGDYTNQGRWMSRAGEHTDPFGRHWSVLIRFCGRQLLA